MGLMWPFLLMYGSHDMRHAGFCRLTVVNGTPGIWGVVKPQENPNFLKNVKMVISVKIQNFSRSQMTKQTSPLESSHKI